MEKYSFMVADNEEFISDIPFEIVDGYWNDEMNGGYDIYLVETDDPTQIRVLYDNGLVYEPCDVFETVHGDVIINHVYTWNPIA